MKKNLPALICLTIGILLVASHFLHFGKGSLSLSIKKADYIMPSAYKVYANPETLNGEYYLFKMLIKNDGKSPLHDVKVSYRIPNYIDWIDLEKFPKIYPGQNVVARCYPQFKDDIVNKMTQSQEKVEIKITYNGDQSINEEYSFKMLGRNQFAYTDLPAEEIASYPDQFRNSQLLGCLVTPQDPIIKYYTQQMQEKVMKGEAASVSNKPEDAVKFLLGVYESTYLSHMVYSGTEGIPQKLGDINSMVQSIRLPREVATGNTGLCIELSLMYASILKSAGLHPVIFLVPGHAYPGILVNGEYYAIEATGIGGEGLGGRLSPKDALQAGMKELKECLQNMQAGDARYSVIDIAELEAKGVVPMELKDDDFLRKKVDEIAVRFSGGRKYDPNQKDKQNPKDDNKSEDDGTTNTYTGAVTFNYPAGWGRYDHPMRQKPHLISVIGPKDGSIEIDVVSITGSQNSNQAIEYIKQQLQTSGMRMQYKLVNSNNGYDYYRGTTTTANNVNFKWIGVFRTSENGHDGVFVGSTRFSQTEGLLNSILATVR
jgi:hypothetical protein